MKLHFIFLAICLLFSCNEKASNKQLVVYTDGESSISTDSIDYTSPEEDTYSFGASPSDSIFHSPLRGNQQLKIGVIYNDTVEFRSYNDEGDYSLIDMSKGKKILSFNTSIESNDLNRGDIISIKWEMDSISIAGDGESLWIVEWIKDITKLKDGAVSNFRKKYPPIEYNYSDDKFSQYYLDNIYLSVEYYLANTQDELVLAALNQDRTIGKLQYSIEEKEIQSGTINKQYIVVGLYNNHEGHNSICKWLYIGNDENNFGTIYEYDLPNDTLITFKE